MPTTVATIVAEELEAARRRIAERIAALMGGSVAAPPPPAPAPSTRFQGRVRARLTPAQVLEHRKRVLAAVKAGATTAGAIIEATGLDRHRVTQIANGLRADRLLRRRGEGRRAEYYLPA